MALPNEHQLNFNIYKDAKSLMQAIENRFGGNTAIKKTQKNLLKQQYENFATSSTEVIEQTYERLQNLISQLEMHGDVISQEVINQKFLRSLSQEWAMHIIVCRIKPEIETLSLDDLFNNLKAYESEGDDDSSKSEEMDLRWNISMLTMRAKRFLKNTGRKLDMNNKERIGYDKSKVECFNCHKKDTLQGSDRAAPRIKTAGKGGPTRRIVPVEETTSNALVSKCDGFGYDWSDQAEEGPTNFALMAYSSTSSNSSTNSEVSNDSNCCSSCLECVKDLKEQNEQLVKDLRTARISVVSYKTGLESVEARLVVFKKNEYVYEEDIKLLKREVYLRDLDIAELKKKLELVTKEKDEVQLIVQKFENSSKSLSDLLDKQIMDKCKTGLGYNAIPPPYTGNFMPPKHDLVYPSLDDFVEVNEFANESVVEKQLSRPISLNARYWTVEYCQPRTTVNNAGPMKKVINNAYSTARRPFNKITAANNNNFNKRVNNVNNKNVNGARPNAVVNTARPKAVLRNRSYLTEYEEIDGGFVAFGGNSKGGKITRKGKIRTGKLDFEDVYFVKELKFNLFSVLQMCDKKNSVLFTDTTCIVLSPHFKLTDENHVLLIVPRKDNMYSVDLKNIIPQGGLTCLFAKATPDESNLWHRRLRHVNFKIMNKLVKGNLVRENLIDLKVKVIRCDNETEFKNRVMNQFCEMKGIKREFSVARTPQQNGVAERKNKTLIEAARTMLADLKLLTTFWAEVVNTACYIQNRVLVIKPHNKTPYELFLGRKPALNFMRPFRCPIIILNTIDHLGKFNGKADEGFFVGYSTNSKAFRVFNYKTRIVEENMHVKFSEDTPNIAESEPNWLFDIDALTNSMNYKPIVAGNRSNGNASTKACDNADPPFSSSSKGSHDAGFKPSGEEEKKDAEDPRNECGNPTEGKDSKVSSKEEPRINQEKDDNINNNNNINTTSDGNITNNVNAVSSTVNAAGLEVNAVDPKTSIELPNDPNMPELKDIVNSDDDEDVEEPKKVIQALKDPSWIEAMQEELLQFKLQQKDERGIVIKNKARLVAQGYTQEEGIDYDEVFAPVARIEAIRLFLAYAPFKDFVMYQMDVKSAFLYGKIEDEVNVCQPLRFEDPDFPGRVYKVEKALYGLHQAPRAWYETLSTYLLDNGFQRGKIDKTLFIKRDKGDILVKKLERRNKSRTPGLKRLRKVGRTARIESSEDKGLGDQEDTSKQGRKIADIDADKEVTLIDETQGRNDDNLMFDTGVLDEQEVEVEKVVSSAEVTTASATTTTTVDELTLAKTLIEIKEAKPKAVTTAATTTTTAVTRPKARGVVVQEPTELEEEERLARQKEEDANIAEWDNVQAMINADNELAARLQAQDQEELTIEKRSKMFVELMDKRKNHFTRLRAEE
ncbi:putative ribonuclease H-like domain-containing protein [Tanacetum coccineum]